MGFNLEKLDLEMEPIFKLDSLKNKSHIVKKLFYNFISSYFCLRTRFISICAIFTVMFHEFLVRRVPSKISMSILWEPEASDEKFYSTHLIYFCIRNHVGRALYIALHTFVTIYQIVYQEYSSHTLRDCQAYRRKGDEPNGTPNGRINGTIKWPAAGTN